MRRSISLTICSMLALASGLAAPAAAQEVRGPESPKQTSNAPSPASTASVTPDQTQDATGSENGALGDVVVTARKVAENQQDVPVAITAFSGAQLQQQNAAALPDIARLTPGLVIRPAAASGVASTFQIRGQYQNDVLATLDPSVGVYVDGLYWARAYGINADLVDVQSVQTLKGPQGTLFGRNTTGGAILVQTNDPSRTGFTALASGTYGNYDTYSLTGIVNVPIITDRLVARVAFQRNRGDGYVRDQISGRLLGNQDSYTIRGKLLARITDNLSLLGSAEIFNADFLANPFRIQYLGASSPANIQAGAESTGGLAGCLTGAPPAGLAGCAVRGIALTQAQISSQNSNSNFATTVPPVSQARTWTYSGTATLDTFFGAVKFIGGYRRIRSRSDIDLDGSRYAILSTSGIQSLYQYSGELQFTGKAFDNSVDFAAGLFYFRERGNDRSLSSALPLLNPTISSFNGTIDTRSQGMYAQATWHVTDRLGLTGGLRYSVEDKGLVANNSTLTAGTIYGPAATAVAICQLTTCPTQRSDDFSGISYTAGVDFKATDDILLYAKTARGFRSGGQNLRATNALPGVATFVPFGQEVSTTYEGGLKSEFFNRRVRLNLAAYYSNLSGLQRSTLVSNASGQNATVLNNAGKARIYGGEVELSAVVTDWFRLDATAAHTNPRYRTYVAPITGFDRSRERFDNVAPYTFTVSGTLSHDFGSARATLRGDYIWQDKTPLQAFNYYVDSAGVAHDATDGSALPSVAAAQAILNATTLQSVGLINARASVSFADDRVELAIFGRNLTDKRDVYQALYIGGVQLVSGQRRPPRTYGVTLSFKTN